MRSLRIGHAEEKVNAILEYASRSELFTPSEQAALTYAEGMTKTPVDVADGVFASLEEHFDTAAIVEITAFVAFQNFNAKFNAALRTDTNELCPIETPGGRWE